MIGAVLLFVMVEIVREGCTVSHEIYLNLRICGDDNRNLVSYSTLGNH